MFRNTMRNVELEMRNGCLQFNFAFHISHFAFLLLLLLSGCSRDHRTPLVVYSPHGRDLLTLFEHRFETLHPDIDVRWLDMGSQDVYDRLRSERANPQADVWFGGPSLVLAQAARDSLLDCRRPVWADAIAPRGRGAGDCYFAAYETPVAFLYAERVVKAEEAPQDWDDLLDPKWKGKLIIRDPLASGTMRAVFGFIILRGMKQSADTSAGFAWLRRLDGQTKVYEQNPAVVRGAKHLTAARAYVDFVGSVEMQLAAAREVYRLPARLDLPADSLPEWVRDVRRRMVVADVDWNRLAEQGPDWMRWWDQHVRGTGKGQ